MSDMLILRNGKRESIRDNDDFADMLEDQLGLDVRAYFEDALEDQTSLVLDEKPCCGECDAVFAVREDCDGFLYDILDEIAAWEIEKLTKKEIAKKRDALWAKINSRL